MDLRKYILVIISSVLLSACMSQPPSKIEKPTSGSGGTISYCRPPSIMRIAEAPSLYVNGIEVATVRNKSRGTVPIDLGQDYRFGLEPSAFFMRVSNQTAYQNTASRKEDRYFIVSGKANIEQGLAVLAGGIIGAAEIDKHQDTGKANWEVTPVSQSSFSVACE